MNLISDGAMSWSSWQTRATQKDPALRGGGMRVGGSKMTWSAKHLPSEMV